MFERYTQQARRVVYFARMEAGNAGGEYIRPEHILIALVQDNEPLWRKVAGPECGVVAIELKGTLLPPLAAKPPLPPSADMPVSDDSPSAGFIELQRGPSCL